MLTIDCIWQAQSLCWMFSFTLLIPYLLSILNVLLRNINTNYNIRCGYKWWVISFFCWISFNNSIIVVLIGACIQVKLCSRAAWRPINNIISLETCKLMEYHDCCVLIVFIYAWMVCWQQGGHIHLKLKMSKNIPKSQVNVCHHNNSVCKITCTLLLYIH